MPLGPMAALTLGRKPGLLQARPTRPGGSQDRALRHGHRALVNFVLMVGYSGLFGGGVLRLLAEAGAGASARIDPSWASWAPAVAVGFLVLLLAGAATYAFQRHFGLDFRADMRAYYGLPPLPSGSPAVPATVVWLLAWCLLSAVVTAAVLPGPVAAAAAIGAGAVLRIGLAFAAAVASSRTGR